MALVSLCSLYDQTGRVAQAETAAVQALAIHREIGNRCGEAVALENLANVLRNTGRVESAEASYEQALTIYRETGDRRAEGMSLSSSVSKRPSP
mgnify:CR=1 FL=1